MITCFTLHLRMYLYTYLNVKQVQIITFLILFTVIPGPCDLAVAKDNNTLIWS